MTKNKILHSIYSLTCSICHGPCLTHSTAYTNMYMKWSRLPCAVCRVHCTHILLSFILTHAYKSECLYVFYHQHHHHQLLFLLFTFFFAFRCSRGLVIAIRVRFTFNSLSVGSNSSCLPSTPFVHASTLSVHRVSSILLLFLNVI